ncbi:MAG: hypothetical protein ABIB79_00445 [archaeon]
MVRKFQINFNFSNRAIYTLVAIGVLIVAGWFVWAYQSGYNDPSIMGHSFEELDLAPLYINKTTNNVGIGMAFPDSKLVVRQEHDGSWNSGVEIQSVSGNGAYSTPQKFLGFS